MRRKSAGRDTDDKKSYSDSCQSSSCLLVYRPFEVDGDAARLSDRSLFQFSAQEAGAHKQSGAEQQKSLRFSYVGD